MAKTKKMQRLQEGKIAVKILSSLYNALFSVDILAEDIGSYDMLIYHEVFSREEYKVYHNQVIRPLRIYLLFNAENELSDLKPGKCIYSERGKCLAVVTDSIDENEAISLVEAHDIILRRFLAELRSEILGLAYKSIRDNKEYLLQVLGSGDILILEGGRAMISIPLVKGIISLHTHPNDFCMFSYKDVESFLDFLIEGGLFAGSLSTKCIAGFLRTRLIDENDYINLLQMGRKLSRVKRNRFAEYMRVINEANKKLTTLRLVMATL